MILEYAQLLSTAHRVLDGTLFEGYSKTGRKQKRYVLSDDRESTLYSATHLNHPSAVWARATACNYTWLSWLLVDLCKEYTHRYHKIHKVEHSGLMKVLCTAPTNIKVDGYTDPPPAMPDKYKVAGDSIASYKNYYIGDKMQMSRWTNRNMPFWFVDGINTVYGDSCFMLNDVKRNRIVSMPISQAQ